MTGNTRYAERLAIMRGVKIGYDEDTNGIRVRFTCYTQKGAAGQGIPLHCFDGDCLGSCLRCILEATEASDLKYLENHPCIVDAEVTADGEFAPGSSIIRFKRILKL